MQMRPYPFDRWPRLTRRQVRAMADLRALFEITQHEEALRCAAALTGANVTLTLRALETHARDALVSRLSALGPFVACILECRAGGFAAQVVFEMSATLAEQVLDRALGGDSSAVPPTLLPTDELSRGALAYVVARCLAALGGGLRLRDISCDSDDIATVLGEGQVTVCSFELGIDGDSGSARLYVPAALELSQSPRARAGRSQARFMDEVPLTLVAQIGRAVLASSVLRTLHVSDIVVLDHCALQTANQGWRGQLPVHVLGSRTHLVCDLQKSGLRVERLASLMEPIMTTGRLSQPAVSEGAQTELAADAPLEIHVELARFSLTLGELQRTQPGDVLLTGQRIDETVTLRVAGRAIAQGELLDVEGEVGVRITRFLTPTSQ